MFTFIYPFICRLIIINHHFSLLRIFPSYFISYNVQYLFVSPQFETSKQSLTGWWRALCAYNICIISIKHWVFNYAKPNSHISPIVSNADNWDLFVEVISSRGYRLFAQLFDNFNTIETTIFATYNSTWRESPLYVESIKSILF